MAAGTVVLVIFIYSLTTQGGPDYLTIISEHRQEIDTFMKAGQESPLPDTLKSQFRGLSYYPVDPTYKVSAQLDKLTENQVLKVGTSDGATKNYVKYANANFILSGIEHKMLILKSVDEEGNDYLFLPFGDQTNGTETYGGGRYLDLDFPKQNNIEIDFNLAYNPYCAYNADYSCPLPPSENRLTVAVRAGEQNFK